VVGIVITVIGALFVGVVVGYLARWLLPGRQKMSIGATVGVGFVAALIGGFIAQSLGVGDTAGVDWIKLAIQVGLAMIGVGLYSGWFVKQ